MVNVCKAKNVCTKNILQCNIPIYGNWFNVSILLKTVIFHFHNILWKKKIIQLLFCMQYIHHKRCDKLMLCLSENVGCFLFPRLESAAEQPRYSVNVALVLACHIWFEYWWASWYSNCPGVWKDFQQTPTSAGNLYNCRAVWFSSWSPECPIGCHGWLGGSVSVLDRAASNRPRAVMENATTWLFCVSRTGVWDSSFKKVYLEMVWWPSCYGLM